MREIKFRLRDRNNKIVGYEKWYSGSWSSDGYWRAKPCWLYSVDNKYWSSKYIPHRFKEQYTGLKDKNGKEIYERDIVEISDYAMIEASVIGQVVWFNLSWQIKDGGMLSIFNTDNLTVIGNVHQNPELMEADNDPKR